MKILINFLIFYPSQNVGNLLPGTNILSTPSLVITAKRITPPEDPSLDMASETAACKSKY
jgi:hypothetical protein